MIILQYWIFTSEIDIIEWDWKKFKPYLFTNNGYCQLLMLCCHCLPCVSPFHKNLRSHILVPSPYLPGFYSDEPGQQSGEMDTLQIHLFGYWKIRENSWESEKSCFRNIQTIVNVWGFMEGFYDRSDRISWHWSVASIMVIMNWLLWVLCRKQQLQASIRLHKI